jgi:hypothetical protein
MAAFRATGRFDFWIDFFVHAGNIAQFEAPTAVGRGMMLLADVPAPFYHYASLLPISLLARMADIPMLDAAVLAWLPLGVLTMLAGVVALGVALAGMAGGLLALAALAILPAPERVTFGNGFLGFAWLLETSPGTLYSVGIGCAALAAMIRGLTDRRRGSLALAAGLTASCVLIRANTFIWLAPAAALTAIAAWRGVAARRRAWLVVGGLVGMVGLLMVLSWGKITADFRSFLFGYLLWLFNANPPTRIDGVFLGLQSQIGRIGVGLLGLVLLPFALLGPWFPVLAILTVLGWRRGRLRPIDAAPWLLILVALIAALLAPVARNGDITEYRQRGGPLVVAVVAIWCAALLQRLLAGSFDWLPLPGRKLATVAGMTGAIAVLALSIGQGKRPRMAWANDYYGIDVPGGLMAAAGEITANSQSKPRIAVANLPPAARLIDDGAYLAAFTGIPAYVSCYGYLQELGGVRAEEATRRMAVLARLGSAPDLPGLQAIMRAEGITHYVVTAPSDAPFDPERRHATGHAGPFAVYALP